MRSRRDGVALRETISRAQRLGVCGFGGVLKPPPTDLDEAMTRAAEQHDTGLARRIGRFAALDAGAFVWTRDDDHLFWLGRLNGSWSYDARVKAADVDLVHVRPCEWAPHPVLPSEAPPAVLATFGRGGRNFQRMHDPAVAAQTDVIWHRVRQLARAR